MDDICFSKDRFDLFLSTLERLAGGESELRLDISSERDTLDAAAYAVNALVGELSYSRRVAEVANRSKTLFLQNMSHEVRTPLTSILACVDVMENVKLSEGQRADLLSRIRINGKALLSIINDLLDLSKIEAGKLQINKEVYFLQKDIHDVIRSIDPVAQTKQVLVQLKCLTVIPETILTCPQRVRQVLVNLLGNAIKFTPEGGIVTVAVSRVNSGIDLIQIDVVDTGIGIDPKFTQKLFSPFAQESIELTNKFGGTGLGLALSKRLAEELGGRLRLVRSELNQGSTFRLTIPAIEIVAPLDTSPEPVDSNFHEDTILKGVHILLAEDTDDLRNIFSMALTLSGAEVTTVENGADAVAKALNQDFDIIVMDINMPVLDGIQATMRLRQSGYAAPILALTAHGKTGILEGFDQAGFTDSVSKPFDMDVIVKKIKSMCENVRNYGTKS